MSGEHTPGPWTAVGDSSDSTVVYIQSRQCSQLAEVHSFGRGYGPDRDERNANAHLIAAAPALLEALILAEARFLEYAESHAAKGTPDADTKAERNREIAALARSAIASAMGGKTDG